MANLVTAVTTSVGVVATSPATLLAANPNRILVTICNTTGTIIYILLGSGTVSATFFTKRLTTSDDFWTVPEDFNGIITCIRNSGTTPQPVLVTEITA
jgi:hypothetical protein